MSSVFYTSVSGWAAVILVGVQIVIPYLLWRSWLSVSLGLAEDFVAPYLKRMWVHYGLGYLVVGLSLVHAWVPMQARSARGATMAGLWLGTAALFLLAMQVVLGSALRDPGLRARRETRRWHYGVMMGAVIVVAGHVWLNK
jgi:uncharacterized membrane protein